MIRATLALILSLLAISIPGSAAAADGTEESENEAETREASETVTGALQGKDGVRIQTMCTHCNSANIQVGGLSADLVPVYRNGYLVQGGLATSMILGILPGDTVIDTQIAKGPGAAQAPAASAGGTIHLTEATPLELPLLDFTVEAGSYDLGSSSFRMAGPLRPWLTASALIGRDSAATIDDDEDGWNDVPSVDRNFAEGKINIAIGDDHDLDFGISWVEEDNLDGRGAFDGRGDTYHDAENPAWVREDTLLERRELRGGWSWSIGKGRHLELRLAQATRDQTMISQQTRDEEIWGGWVTGANALNPWLQIEDRTKWGSVRYSHPIGMSWKLNAGFESQSERIQAEITDLFTYLVEPLVTEYDTDNLETRSLFAEAECTISSRWHLQAGLRHDDMTWEAVELPDEGMGGGELDYPWRKTKTRISPRATLRFKPTPDWTMRLIAGSTVRPPKSIFAEVCCGQKPQRSITALAETGRTVGFETVYQPSPQLRASLYMARTDFRNHLIRMAIGVEPPPGLFIKTYAMANIPEADAKTFEVALSWSPTRKLSLDGSAGWLRFKNRGDEVVAVTYMGQRNFLNTDEIPIDRIPYQPVQTGSVGASYALPGGGMVGGQMNYTGEMTIQQFGPLAPLDEMITTSGFWLVNLSFTLPVTKHIEMIGSVDNLTDKIQTDLGDPRTDYNWGPLSGRAWRLGYRIHLDR